MQKYLQFEIRDTTLADIPKLRAMHAQSWRDTYSNEAHGVSKEFVEERTAGWITPEGLEKAKKHFEYILGNADHLHQVAIQDGRVVGMLHASKVEGKQHLSALYVEKSYYGSGLAQKLMDNVLVWCDSTQPLDLEVATYNGRAKAFYRKHGFEERVGSEHLYAEKIPVVVMERRGDEV